MKARSLFLTGALVLLVGALACQDQGTMAPDDLQPQFAKPVAATTDVTITGGMLGVFLSQPIGRDDKKQLQISLKGSGPSPNLTQTLGSYPGTCWIKNGHLYDSDHVDALAQELTGFGSEVEWLGTNIIMDKQNLGAESLVHLISLNYTLVDNPLGTINLRIGNEMAFGDEAGVVTRVDFTKVGNTEYYTFSGGLVGIVSRAGKIKDRLRIECLLLDDVTVALERNN